jgi:pimeloyl-ACP methyl ester carboxylesterase
MSVAGFLIHYVHFLDPFRMLAEKSIEALPEETPSADNTCEIHLQPPTPQPQDSPKPPVFLSGGYSYGAMITTQLPSLSAIASLFDSPEVGSYAAEIRARAQHLAETQNTRLSADRDAIINFQPTSPRRHVGLRVGGDEEGRSHREPRRSRSAEFEESIRQGVAELVAKTKKAVHLDKPTGSEGTNEPLSHSYEQHHSVLPLIPGRTAFQPAYLLVSPLQGVITNLATMSFPSLSSISGKAWGRLTAQRNEDAEPDPAPEEEAEAKLVQNPTLAIYGDNDIFVPVRKLRSWVARLEAVPGTRFQAHEVSSAGHFWAQGNVASILRDAVRTFASSLLKDAAGWEEHAGLSNISYFITHKP